MPTLTRFTISLDPTEKTMAHQTAKRGLVLVHAVALALALTLAGAFPSYAGTLTGVLNVNTASEEELTQLPGVGESRAKAIVRLRNQRDGFSSAEELIDVRGIGERSLQKLRPFVSFSGESTLRMTEE